MEVVVSNPCGIASFTYDTTSTSIVEAAASIGDQPRSVFISKISGKHFLLENIFLLCTSSSLRKMMPYYWLNIYI